MKPYVRAHRTKVRPALLWLRLGGGTGLIVLARGAPVARGSVDPHPNASYGRTMSLARKAGPTAMAP